MVYTSLNRIEQTRRNSLKGWWNGMYYTIAEVEKIVNISKSAIYKKIKTNEFEPYLSKKQGITYIDEHGLKLIQSSISSFVNEFKVVEPEQEETTENKGFEPEKKDVEYGENSSKYLKHLENEVEKLWGELQEKNNQIAKLSQLVENSQVLLREKSKQDIQLLQEHFDQTDEKIMEVRERMQSKQVGYEVDHKGFWSKLFRNKKRDN